MVIDTSVVLAVLFDEPTAGWAVSRLEEHAPHLRMSTVNLAEVLILLQDRQPQLFDELKELVLTSGIRFVAPTVAHAKTAAEARHRFPLNLGDCFAYALAVAENVPVLTLDTDFARTDISVLLPSG
jgi:ribonuclease VapC